MIIYIAILSLNHLLTLFRTLFYYATSTPPHIKELCRLQVLCICTSNPYLLHVKGVAQSYSRRTEKRDRLSTLLSQFQLSRRFGRRGNMRAKLPPAKIVTLQELFLPPAPIPPSIPLKLWMKLALYSCYIKFTRRGGGWEGLDRGDLMLRIL